MCIVSIVALATGIGSALAGGGVAFGAAAATGIGGITLGAALATDALLVGAAGLALNVAGQRQQAEGLEIQADAIQIQAEAQKEQAQAEVAAAEAVSAQNDFVAAVEENNAEIADNLAEDARLRGEADIRTLRLATRRLQGEAKVGFAARGLLVSEGTPLDIAGDIAAISKLDELTISTNAEREAMAFHTEAKNKRSAAELARMRAESPSTAGSGALLSESTALLADARRQVGGATGLSSFGTAFSGFSSLVNRFGSSFATG